MKIIYFILISRCIESIALFIYEFNKLDLNCKRYIFFCFNHGRLITARDQPEQDRPVIHFYLHWPSGITL